MLPGLHLLQALAAVGPNSGAGTHRAGTDAHGAVLGGSVFGEPDHGVLAGAARAMGGLVAIETVKKVVRARHSGIGIDDF